jgi:hypothetical protein
MPACRVQGSPTRPRFLDLHLTTCTISPLRIIQNCGAVESSRRVQQCTGDSAWLHQLWRVIGPDVGTCGRISLILFERYCPPLPDLRFSHTCGIMWIVRKLRRRIVLSMSRPLCPCPLPWPRVKVASTDGGWHGRCLCWPSKTVVRRTGHRAVCQVLGYAWGASPRRRTIHASAFTSASAGALARSGSRAVSSTEDDGAYLAAERASRRERSTAAPLALTQRVQLQSRRNRRAAPCVRCGRRSQEACPARGERFGEWSVIHLIL